MSRIALFCILFVVNMSFVYAHPVSFEGSKGIMGYHSPLLSHVQLNYSFKHWFALGVHYYEVPNQQMDLSAGFVSANFLIKRWNGASYQANLYGVIGAGSSRLGTNSQEALLSKLQFDIEDREYYFLASYGQINTEKMIDLKDGLVRFGVAPYVANYNDIHSWIILEWRSMELVEGGFVDDVTPFLRVFYKNLLFEIGQSFNGLTRFNYIVHF